MKSKAKKQAQGMGTWKYLNWALYAVMLILMYHTLITRYHASGTALFAITAGWLLFMGLAWYLFEYRLQRVVKKEQRVHAGRY